MTGASEVRLRTRLRPGDVEAIVALHGAIYAREHGFDRTFEDYVAGPLGDFAESPGARERIWIADDGAGIAGCVAIVAATDEIAQLRWFLVDPRARGAGLGTRLLREAVAFSAASSYASIALWTVSALAAAARLYRGAGFVKIEEKPGRQWGVDVVEERYELSLGPGYRHAR